MTLVGANDTGRSTLFDVFSFLKELERNIDDFQKNDGARRLGRPLDADRATSRSLKVFARGIRTLAEQA